MSRKDEKRIPRAELEQTRQIALRMAENGASVAQIAAALDCGRSTVFGWIAAYRDRGPEALAVRSGTGRPPKLSGIQEARLYALLKKNPQQLEFDFGLWTRKIVADLIEREFGVSLSLPSVGRLLHRMGMSPQRPLVRAYEQNPDLVQPRRSS
ncbi:IS630 family transposase [Micromonospora sp. Llam0]|uniref:IS630 family transposase n=1 Tax=Micromonospora sp. Llam0 TaxID=2485143 RepID=UPI0011CD45CE